MNCPNTTVALACNNFIDEGITHDMVAEDKVFCLGEIEEDLRKMVTELEAQVTPSTPLKLLEERRKAPTEAAKTLKRQSHFVPWKSSNFFRHGNI